MATLEREIITNARVVFKNSRLRIKDMQEWSSGEIVLKPGEVQAYIPIPGVYVAIMAEHDKRPKP